MKRPLGLLMLVCGLFLAHMGWWVPLREIADRKPSVSYSTKALLLAPACLIFGIMFLLFSEAQIKETFGEKGSRTPLFWMVTVISVGLGVVAYMLMQSRFNAAGYH